MNIETSLAAGQMRGRWEVSDVEMLLLTLPSPVSGSSHVTLSAQVTWCHGGAPEEGREGHTFGDLFFTHHQHFQHNTEASLHMDHLQ